MTAGDPVPCLDSARPGNSKPFMSKTGGESPLPFAREAKGTTTSQNPAAEGARQGNYSPGLRMLSQFKTSLGEELKEVRLQRPVTETVT